MKLHAEKNGGFTLIELLIVTVVIVTLMGVVFRLAGTGGDSRARAVTIDRLQKLENALSGYYAAYGSYPPVPLQGRSRSIYKAVDGYGVQEGGDGESGNTDVKQAETMVQILAACRAQPIAAAWPPSSDSGVEETLEGFSDYCKEMGVGTYKSGFSVLKSAGSLDLDAVDWRATGSNGKSVQLFQFGLLSFLFPRYLLMLEGPVDEFYDHTRNGRPHGQWAANNQIPCRLDNGDTYENWKQIREFLGEGSGSSQNGKSEAGMITNLASQAVCARWMPNFKGIVTTLSGPKYRNFYGVDVYDGARPYEDSLKHFAAPGFLRSGGNGAELYSCRPAVFGSGGFGGKGGGGGSAHILAGMTVLDGWGSEFFYYSEPPYQSYRLWSAGANKVTFPPWYDLSQFSGDDLKTIQKCTEDDIVHLSN